MKTVEAVNYGLETRSSQARHCTTGAVVGLPAPQRTLDAMANTEACSLTHRVHTTRRLFPPSQSGFESFDLVCLHSKLFPLAGHELLHGLDRPVHFGFVRLELLPDGRQFSRLGPDFSPVLPNPLVGLENESENFDSAGGVRAVFCLTKDHRWYGQYRGLLAQGPHTRPFLAGFLAKCSSLLQSGLEGRNSLSLRADLLVLAVQVLPHGVQLLVHGVLELRELPLSFGLSSAQTRASRYCQTVLPALMSN